MPKVNIKTPWQRRSLNFKLIISKHMTIKGIPSRRKLSIQAGFGANFISVSERDLGKITLKRLIHLLDYLDVSDEERMELIRREK